ncbi:hypothetical protein BKP45_08240 [Anaerobacillus alkalidiazotrophicus]|uniref:Uncharacterized protein n=1 Tax=Anaerobacillus alkalidiazotrophicus TaxID=472963 RepID=A0A1S2M7R5_9BACI|nr:hypothetical protein [Anaerobacillus alkalidiazotrophicus]OIJ20778.1 hypothetical protein BKP45_08240 [Anaerobacillus alkalidiazotrophicus]
MEIISRFVLHIENFFLLSHFSKIIIQWTLTALAVYGLVTFFIRNWDDARAPIYVGFAVRIVLLIGLSIEMLHQASITEITTVYYDRQPSLRQFLHFLFFGYIIVVGFYYIVTLKQKKNQGIFYTFDIAVMALPALQLLTSFFFFAIKGELILADVIGFLIMFTIIGASLYLFFQNYWEFRLETIIPFYLIIGICLILFYITGIVDLMEVSNLIFFLGLLMTYHLIKRNKFLLLQKLKQPFQLTMAILFLALSNPLYNAADVALANTDAELRLRYFETTNLMQLEEAKTLATKITKDGHFSFRQPETQDFHNRYWLRSKNYSVDIDGVSGVVMNVHRQTEPEGKTLSVEEYVALSKQLLEQMGRTLIEDDQIYTTVTEEESRVHVEMVPKYSDGSVLDGWMNTSFSWEKESLMQFHERYNLYPVETLKDIFITSEGIELILHQWYEMLGEEVPGYVVENVTYGYSNRTIEINITTVNQHTIHLDGRSGEILYFSGELANYETIHLQELENQVLTSKNIQIDNWEREGISNFWKWREKDRSPEEKKLSFVHEFSYSNDEPLFTYSKNVDYRHQPSTKVTVATNKEAYKAVASSIDFIPYASRARLTHVIDENDEMRLAWLLVIQPYKKAEHRLYLVDIETKEWVSLYE